MDNTRFFASTVKRELRLRSTTCLVGKENNTRIKMSFTMELSGKSMLGAPGWIGDALEYVSKTGNTSTIDADFGSVDLEFCTNDLFDETVKAPNVQLRKFTVQPHGDSENPDVSLFFTAYAKFSHDLWAWCGDKRVFWATFDVKAFDDTAAAEEEDEGDDDAPTLDFSAGTEDDAADVASGTQAEPLVGDQYDAERREALKPEHDAEFVPAAKVQRPRGFSKATNPSAIQ